LILVRSQIKNYARRRDMQRYVRKNFACVLYSGIVETESGGTRRRTGGEVKGKEANGVGSQAGLSLTRNSPSSVTTIVLARPALQESQYSTELTPPPI